MMRRVSLLLSVVLAAVVVAASAPPAAAQTPPPASEPTKSCGCAGGGSNMASAFGIGFFQVPVSGGGGSCGGDGGGYGAGGPRRLTRMELPQHYAYYPAMHGYYYFYPYNPMHVPTQQAFATQFGMDPRNPYANDFFKVVYAEYKAAQEGAPGPERIPAPVPGVIPKKKTRTN